jgi:hypothetical protein
MGLPNCLGPLKDLIRSDVPRDLRMVMTLLRISTMINTPGKVDLSPITDTFKGNCNKLQDLMNESIITMNQLG